MANKMSDHIITVRTDENLPDWGGQVLLDGKNVMSGDSGDFYPGCHGITQYGDFNSIETLVTAIKCTLLEEGKTVAVEYPLCRWDEDNYVLEDVKESKPSEPVSEPSEPTKTWLSSSLKARLEELDKVLTRASDIMTDLSEGCELEDEAGFEVSEALEAFSDSISWRKYHAFLQALKKHSE